MIIIVLGPAGSGKSTLVGAYARWLESELDASVYKVNLDPAAEYVPYKPDYDIREIIDAHAIARDLGLGPNGALVKAMELLSDRMDEPVRAISAASADYILIDTPGQMEVFLFRDIGNKLVGMLQSLQRSLSGIFVLDATLMVESSDYAFQVLMFLAAQLRLNLNLAPVINKSDLIPSLRLTGDIHEDFPAVARGLKEHGSIYSEMLYDILRRLLFYAQRIRVPVVSALRGSGFEELHRLVFELQCTCGDLT